MNDEGKMTQATKPLVGNPIPPSLTVVLNPVKSASWPENFFEQIHIADADFVRPAQGKLPYFKGVSFKD